MQPKGLRQIFSDIFYKLDFVAQLDFVAILIYIRPLQKILDRTLFVHISNSSSDLLYEQDCILPNSSPSTSRAGLS